MTETANFPSVPKALADALYQRFGSGSTRLAWPLVLPAVQVFRLGGTDDTRVDTARVEIAVIADGEEECETLAEDIRTYLTTTSPIRGAGLLLDGADTEVAPHPVPYMDSDNEERTQFNATYVVISRRDF